MKTKFLFPSVMVLALALSGCAKNEVDLTLQPSDDVETIGVAVATAKTIGRGASATVASLQATALNVYVLSSVTPDGTDVAAANNTLNFTYDLTSTEWKQTQAVTWDAIDYPSYFYSMVLANAEATNGVAKDGTAVALTVTEPSNVETYAAATIGTYEYSPVVSEATNSNSHQDLLYAGIRIASLPKGGKATMNFYHALSKIDIYASTLTSDTDASEKTVYIQSAGLKRVNGTNTFDINATVDETKDFWDETDTYDAASYGYLFNAASYTSPAVGVSSTKGAIIASADAATGSMMIIPQTTTALVSDTQANFEADIANASSATTYVEVIYFGTEKDAASETVAFAGNYAQNALYSDETAYDATNGDSGNYFTSSTDATIIAAADYNAEAYPNAIPCPATDEPLYVKVAFPVAYSFEMGKYYHLTLGFGGITGSTGGLLVDKFYYDEEGNPLPLYVDPQLLQPSDPILPDASGLIGIAVYEIDWEVVTSSEIE